MSEFIAVEGCKLKESAGQGTITITNQPSEKVKFDGKKAYKDKITFSISKYNGGAITNKDGTATGEIPAGSKKVKIKGSPACLENDVSATITVKGTTGNNQPATALITVKVQTAGQKKVKAE